MSRNSFGESGALKAAYEGIYYRHRQLNSLYKVEREVDVSLGRELACNGYLEESDALRQLDFLERAVRRPSSSPSILDLGCGSGGYCVWLARRLQVRALGIDLSEHAIGDARRRAAEARSCSVYFHVGDMRIMALPDSSVDAAISLDALYLATPRDQMLAEVSRVLRPEGVLVFTVFEKDGSKKWLDAVLESRFSVISVLDVTTQWRHHMRAKHQHRWNSREYLGRGDEIDIEPELGVTMSMLGCNGATPFIERIERWEYALSAK